MELANEQPIEDSLSPNDWENLIVDIDRKKCIPFIGPGASNKWVQLDEIVNGWAKEYNYPYPLESSSQLPRVSQFVAILDNDSDETIKTKKTLCRMLDKKALPDFSAPEYENTIYRVLADLNLPIYITTNYDHLMEKALEDRGKRPITDYSLWEKPAKNKDLKKRASVSPTEAEPLVFHLLGDINTPQYMVLTEKDYIDFAIYLSKFGDKYAFPHSIRQTLWGSTLLFVGYRLEDISFIIVFESFIKLIADTIYSIAVQVQMPSNIKPENKKSIISYLENLTKSIFSTQIVWGDSDAFLQQLRDRLSKSKVS